MQLAHRARCWNFDQLVLDQVDLGADIFEHGIIVIDDRIEKRVGKVIGSHFADGASGAANPRPDRFEDVELRFFLECDQEIFSEKHADLLAAHYFPVIEVKHVRDDEKIVVVLLDLRPLRGIEDVFERERMQIETRTERAQDFDVPQPIDVDPGHALIIEM